VFLASGSTQDHALAIWRLSDILQGMDPNQQPWYFEKDVF
jgi:hypothetical protein